MECPCCKSEIDSLEIEGLMYLKLSDHNADIIEKLVTDHPKETSLENLTEFVYAFREEPEGNNSIVSMVSKLRPKIKKYGWDIQNVNGLKSGRGNKAKYKLQKVEV